jgi:predicted ATPase
VVLLAGEPGIGKSRLVQALRERLAEEPHAYQGYACSPHRQDSPLQPVIAQLERMAGFTRGDDPGQKLAKLEALLAQGGEDVAPVVPLLASLLRIPGGERYPPLDLSPPRQRERMLAALVEQLAGLAARRPVLLVWEDVHWADPTSLELLGLAIARLPRLPVLVLVTFRPEFTPPWPHPTRFTRLTLHRLGRQGSGRLIAALTGGKPLPAVGVDQIVAKAEGVPLFVEELTKTVLESGLLQEQDGRYELKGSLPPLAIPATLHDSLMARLDRLAPVKDVAQVAATIGREFSHELLAAVVLLPPDELDRALAALADAELIFRRGLPPQASYAFKHALVQAAAYESALKSRRRQLHGTIARILQERFARTAETEPEVLAHHCTEAGLIEEAVDYWGQAGKQAIARSAMAEAAGHLRRALELMPLLPDTPARWRRELELQTALGTAWTAVGCGADRGPVRILLRRLRASVLFCRRPPGLGNLPGNTTKRRSWPRSCDIGWYRPRFRSDKGNDHAAGAQPGDGCCHPLRHQDRGPGRRPPPGSPAGPRTFLRGALLEDPDDDRLRIYGTVENAAGRIIAAAALVQVSFPRLSRRTRRG